MSDSTTASAKNGFRRVFKCWGVSSILLFQVKAPVSVTLGILISMPGLTVPSECWTVLNRAYLKEPRRNLYTVRKSLCIINTLVFMMPYCSRCGKQVEEVDFFCSSCGAPLKQQPQTGQSAVPTYGSFGRSRFGRRGNRRERLREIIEKFRQKGATSPEKALTAEELGLPQEFKEMMQRRLGRSGVFIEVNGKYYLDVKRLEEVRQEMASRGKFRRW